MKAFPVSEEWGEDVINTDCEKSIKIVTRC